MGTKHFEANFDIVKRENSVILLEENYEENYEGFDPASPESYMMFNLMSKAFFENSVTLADQIETQFKDRVGRKSRGVKQGPFYVLWTPSMPSVLVELGFLSKASSVKPGHVVQTSGLGGIFPKGILVGQVIDTRPVEFGLYHVARVKLAVKMNLLDEVWVMMP